MVSKYAGIRLFCYASANENGSVENSLDYGLGFVGGSSILEILSGLVFLL